MPRVARVAVVLALAGVLVGVGAPALAASSSHAGLDDFRFRSFDAQYTLSRDDNGHAHLDVVETIVAVFPEFDQNKGFYRDIPEYRRGVELNTQVQSVTDQNGDPVPYTTEYYQDFYSVGLGDDNYVHGTQTYVITYSQEDVVQSFADTGVDEFYWDVNGTGWAQPFDEVSMTLTVGGVLKEALTGNSACYDAGGECDDPIVERPGDNGSVTFTAGSTNLVANESLTVSVAFTAGTFTPGDVVVAPPNDGGDYTGSDPLFPVPTWWSTFAPFVLGPLGLLAAWIAGSTQLAGRLGKSRADDIIVPQYTPPKDLNVMVAAYIAGAPDRAFSAQIVSLAVRGNLRLLDHPADSSASFEVELVNVDGVDDLEQKFLKAVFGEALRVGNRSVLDSSNTVVRAKLVDLYKSVDKKLKGDGLLGPTRPTVLWSVLMAVAVVVAVVAVLDVIRQAIDGIELTLSFIAAFVAVYAAAHVYTRRSTVATLSAKGKDTNDYLLGMRDYISLAEADRIKVLQSPEGAERINVDDQTEMVKLYERLLPFAIIFGLENEWTGELTVKALAAGVPVSWWAGSSDFSAWRLISTINNVRLVTPTVPRPVMAKSFASSSSGGWGSGLSSGGWSGSSGSSFSGGSFGGGFSGGGGGGGGGRGR